jgi:ribosomal protein L11 methyltransferase
VIVEADAEDEAVATLHALGTSGIEVRGLADRPTLLAYFPARDGLLADLDRALPAAAVRPVAVPDVDWLARFRAGFRPFEASGFVLAAPWDTPDPVPPMQLVVEPGPAFGTGTHESTQLCLQAIAEHVAGGHPLERVLDVGTGSGILAIAALRGGARYAVGIDDDDTALRWARHHARLNGVHLALVRGDGARALRSGAFDLVLANLTAPALREHAPELLRVVAPAGVLVLSGLLHEDLESVEAACNAAGAARRLTRGDWAALVLRVAR